MCVSSKDCLLSGERAAAEIAGVKVGCIDGAYYGLPFTPEEAALVLVSAPWDVTVSYRQSTCDILF